MHLEVAMIMDTLIGVYLRSELANHIRFELILSLYKSILQKSSILFSLMSTEAIAEEGSFLTWFVLGELRAERGQ